MQNLTHFMTKIIIIVTLFVAVVDMGYAMGYSRSRRNLSTATVGVSLTANYFGLMAGMYGKDYLVYVEGGTVNDNLFRGRHYTSVEKTTVNGRYYIGNSFNIALGAGVYKYEKYDPDSLPDDGDETTDEHYQVIDKDEGYILSYGIGNEWFYGNNVVFGVDWLSIERTGPRDYPVLAKLRLNLVF